MLARGSAPAPAPTPAPAPASGAGASTGAAAALAGELLPFHDVASLLTAVGKPGLLDAMVDEEMSLSAMVAAG